MTKPELIAALKRLKVETGSLVCLGCGYEHNCGIHGCTILRAAVDALEAMDTSRHIMVPRDLKEDYP